MPNIASPFLIKQLSSLLDNWHNQLAASHFQPVFGLAHRHIIGFEALLRVGQDASNWRSTPDFLVEASTQASARAIDFVCIESHLRAFMDASDSANWLFINVLPETFLDPSTAEEYLPALFEKLGFPADSLVIETTLDNRIDPPLYLAAVERFRKLGCLIAVDKFGTGRGSVDQVWQLQPDIIKLDHELVARAAVDDRTHNLMKGMVTLLHEAGALVAILGIETEKQAMVAMQTDCDFVQGFYFGAPQANIRQIRDQTDVIDQLWQSYRRLDTEASIAHREKLAPYVDAFRLIPTRMMMNGEPLQTAAGHFLGLPATVLCFVLDAEGRQIGEGMRGLAARELSRQQNRLQETAGASWVRRPYFRDAMHAVGELQISRPYLSSSTGQFCVTLSIAFESAGQCIVLCGDIDWDEAAHMHPN